jgi:hypothetical protein
MMLVSTLNAELARLDAQIEIERQTILCGTHESRASAQLQIAALQNQRRLLIDPEFFIPNNGL